MPVWKKTLFHTQVESNLFFPSLDFKNREPAQENTIEPHKIWIPQICFDTITVSSLSFIFITVPRYGGKRLEWQAEQCICPLLGTCPTPLFCGARSCKRGSYRHLMLPNVLGGWSNVWGTERNRASPFRKAGAGSGSWSGPHFSLVGTDPTCLPRCRYISLASVPCLGLEPGLCPTSALPAATWKGMPGRARLLPLGSSRSSGTLQPCCFWEGWEEKCAPSKGGARLWIVFEQDGWGVCVCFSAVETRSLRL